MRDFDGVQESLFFFCVHTMEMNGYNYSCVYEKKQCAEVFPVIILKLKN